MFRNLFCPFIFAISLFFASTIATCSEFTTKAIIFDCDGTLVDTEAAQYIAWHYAFERQGYDLSKKEYEFIIEKNSISGLPTANLIIARWGSELLGYNCSEILLKDLEAYSDKLRKQGFPAIAATVAFLHQLAKEKEIHGIKLGLASGASKQQILDHLKHLGIEQYFDVILSGADDLNDYTDAQGTNKPKPYIYLEAAKILNVLPVECVAIEDSITGITAASDAGYITIAVPNTCTIHHDFSSADMLIESFAKITPTSFLEKISLLRKEPEFL